MSISNESDQIKVSEAEKSKFSLKEQSKVNFFFFILAAIFLLLAIFESSDPIDVGVYLGLTIAFILTSLAVTRYRGTKLALFKQWAVGLVFLVFFPFFTFGISDLLFDTKEEVRQQEFLKNRAAYISKFQKLSSEGSHDLLIKEAMPLTDFDTEIKKLVTNTLHSQKKYKEALKLLRYETDTELKELKTQIREEFIKLEEDRLKNELISTSPKEVDKMHNIYTQLVKVNPEAKEYVQKLNEYSEKKELKEAITKAVRSERGVKKLVMGERDIDVYFYVETNITTGFTKKSMLYETQRIWEAISSKAPSSVKSVKTHAFTPMVDRYGNSSYSKAISITVSLNTLRKINWDNFLIDNVPKIAESYWQHPALN